MITKQWLLFLLCFLLNVSLGAFDMPDFFSLENFIESEDDSFFCKDEQQEYTPDRVLKALTRSCNTDEEGIIEAQRFLRLDLYKRTNPINQRSIQDIPQFYFFYCPPPKSVCKSWQLFLQTFVNRTGKANFTRDGTTLGSYLAFENVNIISEFEGLLFDLNLPEIISLLERFQVQEHRGGVMLGGLRRMNDWYLQVRTPVIYLERNFSLDATDAANLKAALGIVDEEIEELNDFAFQHFVADRLGIGDTRLNLGYIAKDCPSLYLAFGLESTIPSAFSLKRGLAGNHFSKGQPDPQLNLCALLNLVGEGDLIQAEEIGTEFLIQVIDRLSRILLETSPGNNGHLGLGAFVYTDLCVMQKLRFKTRAAVEYLMPAPEKRYFIKKKNPEDFDKLEDPDPDDCIQNIRFIEQQIINTFFPSGFDTIVFPGFLFKLTTALTGEFANRWQLMLGHDLWWQQQEKLGSINASKKERDMLRKNLARRPAAIQSKFFASATIFKKGYCCDWSLTFYGDSTFLRSGIGKDFNISVRFEWLL